ncbi:MAG: hypothetical protein GW911_33240 [Armatimonadetes bacterium]|nr:hypothetical protein [Armatimonadota bacterium]NCO96101.1 hypothetical protein [Armatimonadota bacterium]NDK16918.1 hypothetical protein [Armatimonadota bacterium]
MKSAPVTLVILVLFGMPVDAETDGPQMNVTLTTAKAEYVIGEPVGLKV